MKSFDFIEKFAPTSYLFQLEKDFYWNCDENQNIVGIYTDNDTLSDEYVIDYVEYVCRMLLERNAFRVN